MSDASKAKKDESKGDDGTRTYVHCAAGPYTSYFCGSDVCFVHYNET